MCLKMVDKKPTCKSGVGYKQVEKLQDGTYVCFDHKPHRGRIVYPLNKWVTDPNDGDADTGKLHLKYRTGFHISLNVSDYLYDDFFHPPNFPIIKVKFRNVTATSSLNDPLYGRQVVAREIMNLGEIQL